MTLSNLFAISGILIATTCFTLVFILIRFGKTKLHKIWALFNFVVGLWGFGCIFIGNSTDYNSALLSWKFADFGYFIGVVFYHTTLIFTEKTENKLLLFGYLSAFINYFAHLFFLGNDNLAIITKLFGSLYYIKSTSLFLHMNIFIFFWLVILGHVELLKYYRNAQGEAKNKTLYFFIGMFIGFSGGLMNLFPHLGLNIYPYGNFTIPLYCIIATYAILKHKLTDIHIVIRKSIIYSALVIIITLIYLSVVLLFENILRDIIGYKSFLISIFASLLIALLFIPLKNRIQQFVDKYFFKGTQVQIAEENEKLRQEVAQTEKLKIVSSLASGMAHEIKNPLTAIKTFSEFLPGRLEDKEFLKSFSKIVGKEVNRIDDLVHQLLEFSKPSPLQLQRTDIHRLLDDTLDFLNSELIRHNIEVKQAYQNEKPVFLNIDPNKIKQALLNIFLNAIEAMPTGGTLTIVTRDSCHVTRNTGHETRATGHGTLEIIIQDTGVGIDKKDLPHIFDPFFSKKENGTGLGLAVTRQIIQEHGGKIEVESSLGVGTKFTIELPIVNVH